MKMPNNRYTEESYCNVVLANGTIAMKYKPKVNLLAFIYRTDSQRFLSPHSHLKDTVELTLNNYILRSEEKPLQNSSVINANKVRLDTFMKIPTG